MQLVFNSAERVEDIAVCGTRGWLYNAETAEDKKSSRAKNGRLIASLNAAKALGGTPVVFTITRRRTIPHTVPGIAGYDADIRRKGVLLRATFTATTPQKSAAW